MTGIKLLIIIELYGSVIITSEGMHKLCSADISRHEQTCMPQKLLGHKKLPVVKVLLVCPIIEVRGSCCVLHHRKEPQVGARLGYCEDEHAWKIRP